MARIILYNTRQLWQNYKTWVKTKYEYRSNIVLWVTSKKMHPFINAKETEE